MASPPARTHQPGRLPGTLLRIEEEERDRGRGLSERYGPSVAVDGLTFDVLPGRVTGFLGRNGAGKSTTMRLIAGPDAPTAGAVTVAGRPYWALRRPLFEVGIMLESAAIHPGRSARWLSRSGCLAIAAVSVWEGAESWRGDECGC